MSAKVQKCYRCGKRYRGQDDWNQDYIAGLAVGMLCPECQTSKEHVEAEVNRATEDYSGWRGVKVESTDAFVHVI
jgi:hypothetical protein